MLLIVQSRIVIYAQDALKLKNKKKIDLLRRQNDYQNHVPLELHINHLISEPLTLCIYFSFIQCFFSLFLCFSITFIEISPFCVA